MGEERSRRVAGAGAGEADKVGRVGEQETYRQTMTGSSRKDYKLQELESEIE